MGVGHRKVLSTTALQGFYGVPSTPPENGMDKAKSEKSDSQIAVSNYMNAY